MEILKKYLQFNDEDHIIGLTKELNVFLILEALKKKQNIIVLTSSLFEANQYFNRIKYYYDQTYFFPMDDFLTSVSIAISPDLKAKRLETINNIASSNNIIVVTNLMGFLKYLPNKQQIAEQKIVLTTNQEISRETIINKLIELGYTRTDLVTNTGEFAVRGNIIDVFFTDCEYPNRLELDCNKIESIKEFDAVNQISIKTESKIVGTAFAEIISENKSALINYMKEPLVVFINESQINVSYQKLLNDIFEYNNTIGSKEKYMYELTELGNYSKIYLDNFGAVNNNYNCKTIENFNASYDLLNKYIAHKYDEKKYVILCTKNQKFINNFEQKIKNTIITNFDNLFKNKVNIINFDVYEGFEIGEYAVLTINCIEKENNEQPKYHNPLRSGRRLRELADLSAGDYVVHINHGIGIYNGLTTILKNGVKKDYLQIAYKGNDRIYIPVEKIQTIFKYLGKDGLKPRIDSLSSLNWQKTKQELRNRIKDISAQLIKLYAARKTAQGPVFKNYEEEELFANDFEYALTKDQQRAVAEISGDLNSKTPMDRLLCGDVGFGKTEVAFRAMFKTVLNNYQVMYLCPTTILSRQQYLSAIKRFRNYPVTIALLNRFNTPREASKIINDLKLGKINILFGTHRILSEDIVFNNLGLLIIDEEQRFGVSHKEKIKRFKTDVNVLTLSATPIPRTLKMALSGLRDLSLIDTPPTNRFPVQTYVLEENELLIKDAIYKEMSRQGQVYILYNNTEKIVQKAEEIKKLVPEANVVYAHGKMTKNDLERIMNDFVLKKNDVLICTTIIETGIDISNVNTLIVIDSDHFGLSQLYQLRGRVGRSDRIAYAYLFFKKNGLVSEIATKRLTAIKEFTELGSGYRIAMRDLSLRGAGDILGSEQAGFVDAVGLELYLKMIDDEINNSDQELIDQEEGDSALINVDTHISDSYVSDESIKIEIHKLINEIYDYESLVKIKTEIEDRFGKVSEQLLIYMYQEWFEKLAKKINITQVEEKRNLIEIMLPINVSSQINGEKLFLKAYNLCPKIQLSYQNKRISIKMSIHNLEKHYLVYLIPLLEEIYRDISEVEA